MRLDSLRSQDGGVMVMVLGAASVLAILVTTVLGIALNSANQARRDQDWQAALAAAEAGIDDYIYRLNRDGNYWRYNAGNLPPTQPCPPPDSASQCAGNPALGAWAEVPGAIENARFTYAVDASTIATTGSVVVTSTGRVRDVRRTVRVTLRPRSTLDYLYFTEYETLDPTAYGSFTVSNKEYKGIQAAEKANYYCSHHRYEKWKDGSTDRTGRWTPNNSSACTDIYWFGSASRKDIVDGPFHTNDVIAVNGSPEWTDEATTSWSGTYGAGRRWYDNELSNQSNPAQSKPVFRAYQGLGNQPQFAQRLPLPKANSALLALAKDQGCVYTGPTKIRLNGSTMTVTSPYTKSTRSGCLGSNVPLPTNGVVYVQNVPASASDPNYRAGCDAAGKPHPLDLPINDDVTTYDCRAGDIFVEGTLDGALTLAAQNNVVVTWHLRYANTDPDSDDLLGLSASNFVEVYHPVKANGDNLKNPDHNAVFTDPKIHAAIVALQHSFRVQNHNQGATLGSLSIRGGIAQKYRGPTGTFNSSTNQQVSGYAKDYRYDGRLQFLSPPYFIDPTESYWQRIEWAEQAPDTSVS